MMKKYLQFYVPFLMVCSGIIWFLSRDLGAWETGMRWGIFIYFAFVTLVFHLAVVASTKSRPQVFVRFFMASTTIRLFLHMGILVIFSFTYRPLAFRFILTFLVVYFVFTIFEVILLSKQIKKPV